MEWRYGSLAAVAWFMESAPVGTRLSFATCFSLRGSVKWECDSISSILFHPLRQVGLSNAEQSVVLTVLGNPRLSRAHCFTTARRVFVLTAARCYHVLQTFWAYCGIKTMRGVNDNQRVSRAISCSSPNQKIREFSSINLTPTPVVQRYHPRRFNIKPHRTAPPIPSNPQPSGSQDPNICPVNPHPAICTCELSTNKTARATSVPSSQGGQKPHCGAENVLLGGVWLGEGMGMPPPRKKQKSSSKVCAMET